MTEPIFYLGKVLLIQALALLAYHLLLKRQAYFQANRIFLLASLILPFAIPAIPSLLPASGPAVPSLPLSPTLLPQVDAGTATETTSWLLPTYFLGLAVAAAWLIAGLAKLLWLLRTSQHYKKQGYTLVLNPKIKSPYSFLHFMMVPETLLKQAAQFYPVERHELVHIKQGHTWDRLTLALFKVVFWFNPLVYLFDRELMLVHEYLADQQSHKAVGTKEYAQALLEQTFHVPQPGIINAFNQSLIKNRIDMILKTPSQKRLPYLTSLAAFALSALAIACTKPSEKEEKIVEETVVEEDWSGLDKMAEFPGGNEAMMQYLMDKVVYAEMEKNAGIEETVFISFTVDQNGAVTDAKAIKGENENLVAEALKAVNSMPDWEPAIKEGKPVAVSFTIPIRFMQKDSERTIDVEVRTKPQEEPAE